MAGIFQPEISQQSAPPGYSGRTYFADVGSAIGKGLSDLGGMIKDLGGDPDEAFLQKFAANMASIREQGAQKNWNEQQMQTRERMVFTEALQARPSLVDELFKLGKGISGVDYGNAGTPTHVRNQEEKDKLFAPGGALSGHITTIMEEPGAKNADGSINQDYVNLRTDEVLVQYNDAATKAASIAKKVQILTDSGKYDTEAKRQTDTEFLLTMKPLVHDAVSTVLANARGKLEEIGGRQGALQQLEDAKKELIEKFKQDPTFSTLDKVMVDELFAPFDQLQQLVTNMTEADLAAYNTLDKAGTDALNRIALGLGLPPGLETRQQIMSGPAISEMLAHALVGPDGRRKSSKMLNDLVKFVETKLGTTMMSTEGGLLNNESPTEADSMDPNEPVATPELKKEVSKLTEQEQKIAAATAIEFAVEVSNDLKMGNDATNKAIYQAYRNAFAVTSSTRVDKIGIATLDKLLGSPGFAKALEFASMNQTPEAKSFLADTTKYIRAQTAIRKDNAKNILQSFLGSTRPSVASAFELSFENNKGEIVLNREDLLKGDAYSKRLAQKMDAGGFEYTLDGFQKLAVDDSWVRMSLNINPSNIFGSMAKVKENLNEIAQFTKTVNGLPQEYLKHVKDEQTAQEEMYAPETYIDMSEDNDDSIRAAMNAPDGTMIRTAENGVIEKGSPEWNRLIGVSP